MQLFCNKIINCLSKQWLHFLERKKDDWDAREDSLVALIL